MVITPFVVSNLTLKVSGAFLVSFEGSVKSGVAEVVAAFVSGAFVAGLSSATLVNPETRSALTAQMQMDDFIPQTWHEPAAMSREELCGFCPSKGM